MPEETTKKPTDYSGVIIGASLLPVYAIFYFLGQFEMGRSVCFFLAMIMFAIRFRWDLRRRFWFWVVIGLVTVLHIPLMLVVRFPPGNHGWLYMMPPAIADFAIIAGVIRFVEKFIVKSPPADKANLGVSNPTIETAPLEPRHL